jgi:glycosyltransferase involved in cell wall biosynthesis
MRLLSTAGRPRLIIVSSSFHPRVGGAENQGLELARVLRARRLPVVVLTMAWPGKKQASSLSPVSILRINSPRLRLFGPLLAYARGMLSFRRLCRKRRPSVAQLQCLDQFSLAVGLMASLLSVPLIIRIAGAYEMREGYLSGRRGLRRFLAHRLLRRAAHVIALNPEIEGRLLDLGVQPERVLRIPNPIPDRYFTVRHEEGAGRRLLAGSAVLSVGRLDRIKGTLSLIRAFQRVRDSHPSARLHLVGEGPLRPEVEALIAELGLGDGVVLWGCQGRPEDFYAEADVFVLPSEEEGMPNSLLEAMAAGLACAASEIPSTRGIIEPERSGLLFPSGDLKAMSDAICRLLDGEELRQGLGRRARERVRGWSSSVLHSIYLDLYRKAAGARWQPLQRGGARCAG